MFLEIDKPINIVFFSESSNQLKWIALYLKSLKVHIHVVHPNEIKWINESSGKTDKIDAKKLAELGRGDLLPEKVHIVQGDARTRRELISARSQIQSKRVALMKRLRGYLKQEGYKFPEKFFQTNEWRTKLAKLKLAKTQSLIVENFMDSIDALKASEAKLHKEILNIEDKGCELLETLPGIGKLASRTLVAAIDQFDRFENRQKIAN